MFKVNNKDTRKTSLSKPLENIGGFLTFSGDTVRHRSGSFTVNFEHMVQLSLVFLSLSLNR